MVNSPPVIKDPITVEKILSFNSTDEGNAELFCFLFKDKFRYLHEEKEWVCFDGLRWQTKWQDEAGACCPASDEAHIALVGVLKDKLALFEEYRKGEVEFQKKKNKIMQDQNLTKVKAGLEMAAKHPGMKFSITQFDTDPFLLGCQNTIIDLKTGRPVSQSQLNNNLVLKSNNLIYDPQAKASQWGQVLEDIFEGDQDTIAFIKRLFGYTLTGLVREEKLFILLGEGGCGKSTILSVLKRLLGEYHAIAPANLFYRGKWDHRLTYQYDLYGKRASVTIEMQAGRVIDSELTKNITGGDTLKGECKYKMPIEYLSTAKVFWSMNKIVALDTLDVAITQRLCVIPFNVEFRGTAKENKQLKDTILPGELSGIFNWAIEGTLEYQQVGLIPSSKVERKTEEVIETCNPVAGFIKAKIKPNPGKRVTFSNVWAAFLLFKSTSGIQPYMTVNAFSREMTKLGYGSEKHGSDVFFDGIELS